jgi:hypothetical protein
MHREPGLVVLDENESWATGLFEVYSLSLAGQLSSLAVARLTELGDEVLTGCVLPSQDPVRSENVSYALYREILDEKIAITRDVAAKLAVVRDMYNAGELDDTSGRGLAQDNQNQPALRHLHSVE